MFQKLRNYIVVLSGASLALLLLYIYRNRERQTMPARNNHTRIQVHEVTSSTAFPVPDKAPAAFKDSPLTQPDDPLTPPAVEKDDLKRIEGIGPKTAAVLQQAGIANFAELARHTPEELKAILRAANSRGVPATWPEQAKLAAAGDWEALEKLQSQLKGGLKATF